MDWIINYGRLEWKSLLNQLICERVYIRLKEWEVGCVMCAGLGSYGWEAKMMGMLRRGRRKVEGRGCVRKAEPERGGGSCRCQILSQDGVFIFQSIIIDWEWILKMRCNLFKYAEDWKAIS